MKKIAFIVQRYGLEVNGGAEYHCRVLAERLSQQYDIQVLTSCARDYVTWENEYAEGMSILNGVKVRRFPVAQPRNKRKAHQLGRKLRKRSVPQKIARALGLLSAYEQLFGANDDAEQTFFEWSKEQGPYTPALLEFIEQHQNGYDALIFFTYLYFPTTYGLRIAPQKSILIPTAHDEPPIYMPGFKSFFQLPAAILYNTVAEKRFVEQLFSNEEIYNEVAGLGIDPLVEQEEPAAVSEMVPNAPYLIYIGRIDRAKGCEMMIKYFLQYKKLRPGLLKLVLVGQQFLKVPVNEDIILTGFISEFDKHQLLQGAKALIMPSYYESLSLVTLEGMAEGIPVLANKACEVLKDHVEASNAGFLFDDFKSFQIAVDVVLSSGLDLTTLRENGKRYVQENYDWQVVLSKFNKAIDHISG